MKLYVTLWVKSQTLADHIVKDKLFLHREAPLLQECNWVENVAEKLEVVDERLP